MRREQDDVSLLWDMLDAARKVQEFVDGKTFHDYSRDEVLQSAVERKIEIIGEAAIFGPVDASGIGTCFNPDGSVHYTFTVLQEDPAGTRLVLSEGENESSQVEAEYIIAKDGRSLTKEYKFGGGNRWIFDYEYKGRRCKPSSY